MLPEAALLGAVQALTEFFPVSSSGHLLLVPAFFGWSDPFISSLTLSVALHLGTAAAVVIALWSEWRWLARGLRPGASEAPVARRVALGILLSTLAVGAIGLPLRDAFAATRVPWVVAVTLIVFGVGLAVADRFGPTRWSFQSAPLARWLMIGVSQLVALVPGVSRSGITLTTARALGVDRPAAARYAMMLLTPVVLGTGLVQLAVAAGEGELQRNLVPLIVGAAVAAVLGALVVRALLWFVARRSLMFFAGYRIALGTATLALLAADAI